MTTPKISIIICSIDAGRFARITEHYRHLLAGTPYEIIGIHDARSLAEGYNRGIAQSDGDILMFSHDDIMFLDDNFPTKIRERMASFDLLGFVGTTKIVSGNWFAAGQPHLHGVISHAVPGRPTLSLDVFGTAQWPVINDIKAIDGLCMIATRQLASTIGFDAETFDGFHLYDIDFSFTAHLAGYRLGICCDIPVIHESSGKFDVHQAEYGKRFCRKHAAHITLPADTHPKEQVEGRHAIFADLHAVLRAWQPELLQRATQAILHETEGNFTDNASSPA